MRKIYLLAVLAMLALTACNTMDSPMEGDALDPNAKAYVAQVNGQGDAALTIDESRLERAFVETYQVEEASDMHIMKHESGFYLMGFTKVSEETKVTFAIALEEEGDGSLYFNARGGSQSCTANAGCDGCELTVISPTSGSCKCIAAGGIDPKFRSCTHSVTVTFESPKNGKPSDVLGQLVQNINKSLN